ncbi:MAG TPA: DUF3137 domain-containing protein [Allosphingosinicella sp.]|jgi:hypothetical protein
MIELGASHFADLCACETVRERIGTVEAERQNAARTFWTRGLTGIVLAVAALLSLLASGWEAAAIVLCVLILIGAGFAAAKPLMEVSEGLKLPVLEELARRASMEYLPGDFTPPVYDRARGVLFGSGLTSQTFTDLFHGADEGGCGHAVYEACLQRRVGKNSAVVFSGQIYAIHRATRAGGGITVAVPDRSIFNFFKPASDMERVKIEGDEAFEKRFEIYSTAPMEAKQLFFSSDLRRALLALREEGAVSIFVSAEEALVAVSSGKNRFEAGSMLRRLPPEDRVKRMFDDLAASLETLSLLRRVLG